MSHNIVVVLNDDDREEIRSRAAEIHISTASFIRMAIKKYLENKE